MCLHSNYMKKQHSAVFLLPFLIVAAFIAGGLFFVANNSKLTLHEPLADPKVLSQLLNHEEIPAPVEEHYAEFHGMRMNAPELASLKTVNRVLGTTSPSDKRIEVDLARQHVYAYEGNKKVFDFLTSTGKWGRTPTGTFHIWVKLKSVLMSGGSGADYYYLPNVPWVMFFSNNEVAASRGYSLHGTYWHNNFGHPMSHGCVNLRTEDAALLFQWAEPTVTNPKSWATYADAKNPGTEIVIYGEPPEE